MDTAENQCFRKLKILSHISEFLYIINIYVYRVELNKATFFSWIIFKNSRGIQFPRPKLKTASIEQADRQPDWPTDKGSKQTGY